MSVAFDEELSREVALKEILPDKADKADLRGRFILEAEITGRLEHPGIVPVYSLNRSDDGRPYYAMRLIRGKTLENAIARFHAADAPARTPSEQSLALRGLLRRLIDVCNAVAYAHSRGVLHRDLKPENIMLGPFGETLVLDWGLAKATGRREPVSLEAFDEPTLVPPSGSGHALTVGAIGSAPYMSPEQAALGIAKDYNSRKEAVESLGPATDVYGLGAILFALLTGKPAVEGKTRDEVLEQVLRGAVRSPRALNPKTPRALEAVCLKALDRKPERRYPSARALADDVEQWLADKPVSVYRDNLAVRASTLRTTVSDLCRGRCIARGNRRNGPVRCRTAESSRCLSTASTRSASPGLHRSSERDHSVLLFICYAQAGSGCASSGRSIGRRPLPQRNGASRWQLGPKANAAPCIHGPNNSE